jgi:hypothetical protein
MRVLRDRVFVACLVAFVAAPPVWGQSAEKRSAAGKTTNDNSGTIWVGGLTAVGASERITEPTPAPQQAEFCCDSRRFGMTAIETGFAMVIPWYFNRFVSDDSTAVLSLESWGRNIREGFEWDHDNFKTNMWAHPFHGNLYFNAARSNGYDFYESAAWAWGGSFLWEMFGENNRPAINDWIATAVGGIAIGEMLHRASATVWDNEATGTERALREFGGFVLNPMGGASRLFRGEMGQVGENPADRYPSTASSFLNAGVRSVGEGGDAPSSTGAAVHFGLRYGDGFEDYEKPFENFEFDGMLYGKNEDSSLGLVRIRGGLWGTEVSSSSRVKHVFRLEQMFNYINNRTIETGGSAVAASFNSRWTLSDTWGLQTRVAPAALLIWGTGSEYADFTKREYDFGTGFGVVTGAALTRRGRSILAVDYAMTYQHTLNGAAGTHLSQYVFANAGVPVVGPFGLGVEYRYYIRNSDFRDFPDVNRRHPDVFFFVSLDTTEERFRRQ